MKNYAQPITTTIRILNGYRRIRIGAEMALVRDVWAPGMRFKKLLRVEAAIRIPSGKKWVEIPEGSYFNEIPTYKHCKQK